MVNKMELEIIVEEELRPEDVSIPREEKENEATTRLQYLSFRRRLNPIILNRWYSGELTYSAYDPAVDKYVVRLIRQNAKYEQIVRAYEQKTGSVVYHVIERDCQLALLYVSDYRDYWWSERPEGDTVFSAFCTLYLPLSFCEDCVLLEIRDGAPVFYEL